jgi:F-type H+-transporting ATPase subunit delta
MKISKQARREAKQLFRSCVAGGVLDENRARLAVTRVLELKPRGYVPILSHFQRLLKLDLDRRTATIESAVPLTPEVREQVQANLGKAYGAGLNITFAHNPALIGGMRIKVGSDVYDGSIRARLDALQESF